MNEDPLRYLWSRSNWFPGWKVVRKSGSFYKSALKENSQLIYAERCLTIRLKDWGPLAVFGTYSQAESFAQEIALGPCPILSAMPCAYAPSSERFLWDHNGHQTDVLPDGTRLADAIILGPFRISYD